MENKDLNNSATRALPFMKWLYIGFVGLGMYYLFKTDWINAAIQFGIALAFDPFDPEQSWKLRPIWQRLILIVHLLLAFGCLLTQLIIDDSVAV